VGVNLVLNLEAGQALAPEEVPVITLALRRVSLYDALRYVTEVAGLELRFDENAAVISRVR
jgi:hypothetical protein